MGMDSSANDYYGKAARDFYGATVDEFPKAVRCPTCDGDKWYAKTIFKSGIETTEEVLCEECNEDGKVWVYA